MKTRLLRITAIAIALSLAGCAAGPDFDRPSSGGNRYKGDAPWSVSSNGHARVAVCA